MSAAPTYHDGAAFTFGFRNSSYTWSGGSGVNVTANGLPFSRYTLFADRLVLSFLGIRVRTVLLSDMEKISFWYSLHGAKAQVFVNGSVVTVILSTGRPVELGGAFEKLGVKVETAKSVILYRREYKFPSSGGVR